ncbi:MAG: SH3 domain-containing protein [Muribaculaceae bacterium]|nr:SH3 domain-containing protein [Muribaculaceae bacterium]MBP5687025.1 SH3 domain-containing protein [Muribaculaceae bacterium]
MKKIFLATLMLVMTMSVFAQTQARAYILDESGSPTNVRNAPNGKVVKTLPGIDGGYVVQLLECKNNWWKIDPLIDIYGSDDEDHISLKGSKTGYWVHNSVLAFGIAGEQKNVIREKPSAKAKPLKLTSSYLFEVALRPLEIKGGWIKVITTDKKYTGWMPISKICDNPLTTCP